MSEPKRRGRPPGTKNKPKPAVTAPVTTQPQTIGQLSNEQRKALTFHHRSKYNDLLARKKQIDADLKNHAKLIKADLGEDGLDEIKVMNKIAELGDTSFIKQKISGMIRAAEFMAKPLGAQSDLFEQPDRRPIIDKAEHEGETAGLEGKNPAAPYDGEAGQAWMRGWHAGQSKIRDAFLKRNAAPLIQADTPEAASSDFDDALAAAAPAEPVAAAPEPEPEPAPDPREMTLETVGESPVDVVPADLPSFDEGLAGAWPDGADPAEDVRPSFLINGGDDTPRDQPEL